MKIQPMKELLAEIRAVARGEISVSADAAQPSAESADALRYHLTRELRPDGTSTSSATSNQA